MYMSMNEMNCRPQSNITLCGRQFNCLILENIDKMAAHQKK